MLKMNIQNARSFGQEFKMQALFEVPVGAGAQGFDAKGITFPGGRAGCSRQRPMAGSVCRHRVSAGREFLAQLV